MALNLRPAPTLERVAGGYNVKQFGAAGDGTTDDSDAVLAAVDAAYAAGGGVVYFPAGTYAISKEIVPSNTTAHVAFVGTGWGIPASTASGSWEAPTTGSIIKQTGSGLNGIHVNTQISGITVRDLAIQFTQASTGHGIFFDAEAFLSGTSPSFTELPCVMGYEVSNVLVYGHDASHYGYWFGNALNGRLSFLNASGKGGFYKFHSYHPSGATATYNFGNTVMDGYWQFAAPDGVTYAPSVATISYEVNNNTTAGTPVLNYIHHRGVLDIILNADLTANLVEGTSTGTESGTGDALTIAVLVQDDLGTYTANIDNDISGLFVGISDEIPAKLSWTQQPNFRYEYSPVVNSAALSGSSPGTIQTVTVGTASSALFRVSVNLNVNTYTSGTVEAEVTYTSGWDSAIKTQTLCSLSADGETSGTALLYVSGGTTFTVKIAGTFVSDFHSYGIVERMLN